MKFEKFNAIRETLKEKGIINESVKSFREYSESFMESSLESIGEEIISSPIEGIEEDEAFANLPEFDSYEIDEAAGESKVGNFFKNIFGFAKIKGLGNTYMKAMVDEGIADMDYSRRKAASDSKEETEQLKMANTAKKAALKDKVSAIAEKMDSIASTDFLKTLTKKVKITARLKKNQVILKIASKEEAKELKLKNAELTQDLQSIDGELRNYQKELKDDAKGEGGEELKVKIKEIGEKIDAAQKKIIEEEDKLKDLKESAIVEAEGDVEPSAEDVAKKNAEKAKIYTALAQLKAEKFKLIKERGQLQDSYNKLTGTDEYNVEDDAEEAEALAKDAKDYERKAKEAEAKADKTEPTTDKEATDKEPEKEPEEEVEDAAQSIKDFKNRIADENVRIASIKKEIEELERKKEASTDPDEIQKKIELKKNDIKDSQEDIKEINKEIEKLKKTSESLIPSYMSFSEFRTKK